MPDKKFPRDRLATTPEVMEAGTPGADSYVSDQVFVIAKDGVSASFIKIPRRPHATVAALAAVAAFGCQQTKMGAMFRGAGSAETGSKKFFRDIRKNSHWLIESVTLIPVLAMPG